MARTWRSLGFGRPEYLPVGRGFVTSLGFMEGAENHFNASVCSDPLCLTATGHLGGKLPLQVSDLWHDHGPGTLPSRDSKRFLDDRWTDFAIAGMSERGDKPYFSYLTLAAAHAPLQAPESALEHYDKKMFIDRRLYAGMMTQMDFNIGRFVDALKTHKMWNQTYLIFTSDNGGTGIATESTSYTCEGKYL